MRGRHATAPDVGKRALAAAVVVHAALLAALVTLPLVRPAALQSTAPAAEEPVSIEVVASDTATEGRTSKDESVVVASSETHAAGVANRDARHAPHDATPPRPLEPQSSAPAPDFVMPLISAPAAIGLE